MLERVLKIKCSVISLIKYIIGNRNESKWLLALLVLMI